MTDIAKRSPFHAVQERIGGAFGDWDGWIWTTGFGNPAAEYAAIRDGVGVWDCSGLIKWEYRGPDALRAVDRLVTHDVGSLGPGRVRYTALVDEAGRMVDDATVYVFGRDRVWLMTNRFDLESHLRTVTADLDATIELIVFDLPHVQLQGPRSREVLQRHVGVDLATLGYFRFLTEPVKVAGVPAWITRTGVSGELGYELFVRPEGAEPLWERLTADGAVVPYGFDAVDIARIESGMILPGFDYTPGQTSPYDIDFERFIRLDKAEPFHGRQALAAAWAAGPKRRLATLVIEGDAVPEAGAAVTANGEPAGTATSPTASPRFGTIALAVLERRFAEPGTRVEVALGDGTVPARVERPSIYDPEKRRVRM
jgi:aminomethyltransferase